MLRFILLVVMAHCAVRADDAGPMVCFEKRCVRGKTFKGNVKEFEGFLGIPYAKPPVGELRLKDPEPIEQKIDEVYNATEERQWCMQKNYLIPNPTVCGVEDCLYLNVYRPKNAIRRRRRQPLPVIVYIHGGGFFAGTSSPSYSGADYFMDSEDVIVVAMAYRLGPLGFLSTGDSTMSGNFGLKDQALAIKWVKDNIRAFGGDSSNIALMGQSAGASSAHLHMMSSPKWARNSFQKVIMLSGNGNGPYAYVIKDPLAQAKAFAKAMNIDNYDHMTTSSLAHQLRFSDPEALINACDKMRVWSVDPLTISRPVVENCEEHDGFLCDDPVDLWRSGDYAKVPMLTGFMDGDGGVRALAILENKTELADLNKNFDKLIPKLMEVEDPSAEITAEYLEMIKQRYFNGMSEITEESANELIRLYTERSFISPLYNTLQQLVAQDRKTPAYLYKFSFEGNYSYANFYTGNFEKNKYGVVHCDELIYLIRSRLLFPNDFKAGSMEALFTTKFVKFFTDFVTYGRPPKINGKVLHKCEATNFKSAKPGLKCNYVEFGNNMSVTINDEIDPTIAAFWNEIDPKMVQETKPPTPQIEATQIFRNS